MVKEGQGRAIVVGEAGKRERTEWARRCGLTTRRVEGVCAAVWVGQAKGAVDETIILPFSDDAQCLGRRHKHQRVQ